MTPVQPDPGELLEGQAVAICPACGARNLARARFCMECGARMAVESGERRIVSVVFADLSGFTSYSETVDPEAVRALADEAAHGLGRIVEQYGGTVDKIIGDCVMAIFGAPVSHEDDAARAVRAALDMQAYVSDHADRFAGLQLSVGVYTGEAIYAPVGPSGAYTVLGDAVNTAARLQGAADKGEVLIGDPTFQAAAGSIEAVELPPIVAKNKKDPVPAWRAVAVSGERPVRKARRTRLVGRRLEMDRLLERWEVARSERIPQLVAVTGSPGVGKSRLVEHFLERAGKSASIARGRCLDYGEGITYWPIIEMIRSVSGIRHDDDPDAVSRKLGNLLESLGTDDLDQLRTIAVAVANVVDAPTTPRGTYRAEKISRSELHWGLRRIFELLARRHPLVLVFEDLHWAEPTLLELVDFFMHGDDQAPLMLLATGRPELKENHPEALAANGRRRLIEVGPLSKEESEELLAELVGPEAIEPMRPLLHSAGGNPLFLEEIVRMFTDYGVIDEEGRPTGGPIEQVPVPSSLHALIGSRLDRLADLERQVAGDAAVVGEVFWTGAVRHLQHANGEVSSTLVSLEDREVVRPLPTSSIAEEEEWAFAHAMIREVAYDRIPKARRATLHERCGEWIARVTGDDDDYVEFVAYHFEQACRLAMQIGRAAEAPPVLRAVKALTRAGNKALNREGLREAERYFSRALDLIGDGYPEARAELGFSRAQTLWSLGRMDDALASMVEVSEAAGSVGRDDLKAHCLVDLATKVLARGHVEEANRYLADAEATSGRIDDAELRATLALVRAQFIATQQAEHALEEMERAVALADAEEIASVRLSGRLRLGTMLLNIGELARADRALLEAVEIAGADGSVRSQALASTFLAYTRFCRGPREDAELYAGRSVRWLKRLTGHAYYLGQALQVQGMTAMAAGDLMTAEEHLREAFAVAEDIGGSVTAEIGRQLTEVMYRQGWRREVRAIVEDIRQHVNEGDPVSRAYLTLGSAFVAAAEQNGDEAQHAFKEALLLLEELRMAVELANSRISAAWAFRHLGMPEEARAQVKLAARAAASMGADAILADAEREEQALRADC